MRIQLYYDSTREQNKYGKKQLQPFWGFVVLSWQTEGWGCDFSWIATIPPTRLNVKHKPAAPASRFNLVIHPLQDKSSSFTSFQSGVLNTFSFCRYLLSERRQRYIDALTEKMCMNFISISIYLSLYLSSIFCIRQILLLLISRSLWILWPQPNIR